MDLTLPEIRKRNEYYARIIAECHPPESYFVLKIIESVEIPVIPAITNPELFKATVLITQSFEKWKKESIEIINKL